MSSERPCRIVLVGMMGSGKSTVGRLLSDATGWPYVDNDDLVRRSHGATPRGILARDGEGPMRAAESSALRLGLESPPPSIVGAAAGTILEPENRELMRAHGIVVWLRADADSLEARAFGAEHRPWLDTGGDSWIRTAVAQRAPLYSSVADITVDTSVARPDVVATELRDRLTAFTECR